MSRSGRPEPRTEVRSRTPSTSTSRIVAGSGEGTDTGDVRADDEGPDGFGASVGVNRLDVGHVPHHVEVQQDPLPLSRSRASEMSWRASRVLFILAIAAIVSVSVPASISRPTCRQYSCIEHARGVHEVGCNVHG
jgi:hypothetical protein